jgi:hypothetical protein
MGTHGSQPTMVPEVPVRWTQPVISPADLQVGLETLSTTPMTLKDSGRPYPDPGGSVGLVAQDSSLDRDLTPPLGPHIMGFTL